MDEKIKTLLIVIFIIKDDKKIEQMTKIKLVLSSVDFNINNPIIKINKDGKNFLSPRLKINNVNTQNIDKQDFAIKLPGTGSP